jgi:phosphatidylserine decarboxylase
MKLHKEGNTTIALSGIILVIIISILYIIFRNNNPFLFAFSGFFLLIFILIVSFFRKPTRIIPELNDKIIYAPADGKVVVVEKTKLDEFINEDRLQISIFMSPVNVHINWYPISGVVKYFKHHCGNYFVAWHPKSSCENERTTIVLENKIYGNIILRQIAGAMARRIVSYSQENEKIEQGQELGFIKFGSRVDLFLPLNAKINVELNQKVKGNKTIIAEF